MGRDLDAVAVALTASPQTVTFAELRAICEHLFGRPRSSGSSHLIFKTGLRDPAIISIQRSGKMAKPYPCRQAARAIALRRSGDSR